MVFYHQKIIKNLTLVNPRKDNFLIDVISFLLLLILRHLDYHCFELCFFFFQFFPTQFRWPLFHIFSFSPSEQLWASMRCATLPKWNWSEIQLTQGILKSDRQALFVNEDNTIPPKNRFPSQNSPNIDKELDEHCLLILTIVVVEWECNCAKKIGISDFFCCDIKLIFNIFISEHFCGRLENTSSLETMSNSSAYEASLFKFTKPLNWSILENISNYKFVK